MTSRTARHRRHRGKLARLTAPALLLLPSLAMAAAPQIQRQVLPDGLEILVAENHALPLFTVEIAAKNGSMTEPPEYNGLSHLYEHMFFKANQVLPTQEAYMARLRELGIQFNGTTNTERVNYFFTTTSDHLSDAMVFMRDAILSPLFDAKELERERVVVTGEMDRNEANPFYHLYHQALERIWWKFPSRKDPLGNRKTVLSATPDMMRTIQSRYYVPNNSVLVVSGDVNAADVFKQAAELYAGWKKAEDPFTKYPLVKHPPIPKREVVLVTQPVETVTMQLDWHGPSTRAEVVAVKKGARKAAGKAPAAPDPLWATYAADVLGVALGEPSSKFQKALVESGACVGAGLAWYTQVNTGPITLGLEATPEKAEGCLKAALEELPKIKAPDYFSDEEIANAAHHLEVAQVRERETPSEYAHILTFWWASAGLDYFNGYVDKVKRVQRAEFARFLDAYVIGKPYVAAILVSPEMEKEKHLDKARFEALIGASSTATAEPVLPSIGGKLAARKGPAKAPRAKGGAK